jgi:hypothetical protein
MEKARNHGCGPFSLMEIAHLLAEIDEAIGFLNEAGPGSSSDQA